MKLNLPIFDLVADSQNILIAGAGGGYDVYAGLPLYFALCEQGKTVHLANYSFTEMQLAKHFTKTTMLIEDLLIGAHGHVKAPLPYIPEPYLAQWFLETRGEEVTVWMFANTGAVPLTQAYRKLVAHLNIDALILVDGGVDSIMTGGELGSGTILEDSITLCAVQELDIPVKISACIGFGAEVEEQVCHYNVLQNMAALVKQGAFYGGCALTTQMEAFQLYESACRYAWEKPNHLQGHISTRIVPAVHGEFGDFHLYPYGDQRVPILVSPLMSLYWFFDTNAVIANNKVMDYLRNTETKQEAIKGISMYLRSTKLRPRKSLPY